jgi:hypothetical protein
MHYLAHHAGEQALAPLLLLGGAWLSVLVAYSRERLAMRRPVPTKSSTPPATPTTPTRAPATERYLPG